MTREHFAIFGEWCLPEFINQDADPYLFEVYRKFYAATINPELVLTNEIGGAGLLTPDTRYEQQHIRWQDELLKKGINRIQDKYPHAKTCSFGYYRPFVSSSTGLFTKNH